MNLVESPMSVSHQSHIKAPYNLVSGRLFSLKPDFLKALTFPRTGKLAKPRPYMSFLYLVFSDILHYLFGFWAPVVLAVVDVIT